MSDVTTPQPVPGLDWLLEDFAQRVPGAQAAFLASSDGIELATAGLTGDQSDRAAALVSSLYSLARGVGQLTPHPGPDAEVRQVVIELGTVTLFLMVAGQGLPHGVSVQFGADRGKTSSVLGVLASADAHAGLIGHEMATMIKSVAEHLVTDARHHAGQGR